MLKLKPLAFRWLTATVVFASMLFHNAACWTTLTKPSLPWKLGTFSSSRATTTPTLIDSKLVISHATTTLVKMNMNDNLDNKPQRRHQDNIVHDGMSLPSRRTFLSSATTSAAVAITATAAAMSTGSPQPANAIGPVKINLIAPIIYNAQLCPKDRPIPGEKAMKGMRGLCVTVKAKLEDRPEKPLTKVGVYGFVTDEESQESVLANNPDFGTDAGQFAMIESVTPQDDNVVFEFIAAVPMEKDLSKFDNGIGPLSFESLRIISFPGGQQYGAISPCEMNEFSDECEAWEAENGPYQRGEFMVRPNSRTKGL